VKSINIKKFGRINSSFENEYCFFTGFKGFLGKLNLINGEIKSIALPFRGSIQIALTNKLIIIYHIKYGIQIYSKNNLAPLNFNLPTNPLSFYTCLENLYILKNNFQIIKVNSFGEETLVHQIEHTMNNLHFIDHEEYLISSINKESSFHSKYGIVTQKDLNIIDAIKNKHGFFQLSSLKLEELSNKKVINEHFETFGENKSFIVCIGFGKAHVYNFNLSLQSKTDFKIPEVQNDVQMKPIFHNNNYFFGSGNGFFYQIECNSGKIVSSINENSFVYNLHIFNDNIYSFLYNGKINIHKLN